MRLPGGATTGGPAMDLAPTIALSMGLAWASGINLYAALCMLGLMATTGHIELPPDLQVLERIYWVLWKAIVLLANVLA